MPEMRSSVAFYALLFSILTVGGIGIWWLQREVETVASEATPAAAENSEGGVANLCARQVACHARCEPIRG